MPEFGYSKSNDLRSPHRAFSKKQDEADIGPRPLSGPVERRAIGLVMRQAERRGIIAPPSSSERSRGACRGQPSR